MPLSNMCRSYTLNARSSSSPRRTTGRASAGRHRPAGHLGQAELGPPLRASTSAVAFRMPVARGRLVLSVPRRFRRALGSRVQDYRSRLMSRGLTIREARGCLYKICQSVTLCSCPTNGSARTTSPRGSSGDRPSTPGTGPSPNCGPRPAQLAPAGSLGVRRHRARVLGADPPRRHRAGQPAPELFSSANGIALDPMPAELQRIATFFLMMTRRSTPCTAG